MQEPIVTQDQMAIDTETKASISLVDVVRFYEPARFPHQRNSIDWLQKQTSSPTLSTFVQRWNNPFVDNPPMLIEGDRNQAVVELQTALNRWRISVAVDGDFGPLTKAAVMRFQQQRGLKMDGIVGNQTWGELFKSAGTIRLADLFNIGKAPNSQQTDELKWLQSQLSKAVMTEFAKRWRNQV